MISGAAFCPQPPLLVPDVAVGAAPELDSLRTACTAAIARIAAPGRRLVVLGGGPASAVYPPSARGTLAPYGVPIEVHLGGAAPDGEAVLPLSLTIGAWLLTSVLGPHSGAVGFAVGPDFASSAAAAELGALTEEREVALLVMGDGSARRSTTAPGYLDERAEPFDALVSAALQTGDAACLASLDAELGAELLAAGVPAWQVAGRLLAGRDYAADLLYDDAPCGVGYFVAAWITRD